MVDLTANERYLLEALAPEDMQYGECFGRSLDGLIAKGLAIVRCEESGVDNTFIAKSAGPDNLMYRAVAITDAGRDVLAHGKD
jgi:hypothetical protein